MTRACFAHSIAGRGNVRFAHTGVICVRRLRARPRAGALPCAAVWGHLVPATVPRALRFPLGACGDAGASGPAGPAPPCDARGRLLLRDGAGRPHSAATRPRSRTEQLFASGMFRRMFSDCGRPQPRSVERGRPPGVPGEGTLPARSDGRLAGKPGASRGAVPFLRDRGGRARAEACVAPTGGGVRNQRL